MSNTVLIHGYNNAMTTTVPMQVIGGTAAWVPPTTARIMSIVSSSAADTAAGANARTLLVEGVDAQYQRQQEVVVLNGVTPVLTVYAYRWIRMRVLSVGTGGYMTSNAGTITATAQVDLTVQSIIPISSVIASPTNISLDGTYLVPLGSSGLTINRVHVYQALATATTVLRAAIMVAPTPTGPWSTLFQESAVQSGNGSIYSEFPGGLYVPERSFIRLHAQSSAASNPVGATVYARMGAVA